MTQHLSKPLVPVKRRLQLSAESGPDRMASWSQAEDTDDDEQPSQLLLCDFDNTLADFDTGDYTHSTGLSLHLHSY